MEQFNSYSNECVRLIKNGEEFFPRLCRAIKSAKKEVLVETFEFGEDRVGRALLTAMSLAVRRGVQVFLTIDAWGSKQTSMEFVQKFIDVGVVVQLFEPTDSVFRRYFKLYSRVHRKLAIIDAETVFTGGINLSQYHLMDWGEQSKKDLAVEIRGKSVADFRQLYLNHLSFRDLNRLRIGHATQMDTHHKQLPTGFVSAEVVPLVRNNQDHNRSIEHMYIKRVDQAEKTIYLAFAYFYPSHAIQRALIRAAKRGVEVHIVIQANPDETSVLTAARSLYSRFLKAGIKIHEYQEQALHVKTMIVDEHCSLIGSSNLDPWSLNLNLEASVVIGSDELAKEIIDFIQSLIDVSTEVKKQRFVRARPMYYFRLSMRKVFRGFFRASRGFAISDPLILRRGQDRSDFKFRVRDEKIKSLANAH